MNKELFYYRMNFVASNIRSLSTIVAKSDNEKIKDDLNNWNQIINGQIDHLKQLQNELNQAME